MYGDGERNARAHKMKPPGSRTAGDHCHSVDDAFPLSALTPESLPFRIVSFADPGRTSCRIAATSERRCIHRYDVATT